MTDVFRLYIQRLVLPLVGADEAPTVAEDCAWILIDCRNCDRQSYYDLACGRDDFPAAFLVLSKRSLDYAVDLVVPESLAEFIVDTSLEEIDVDDYHAWLVEHIDASGPQVVAHLEQRHLMKPQVRVLLDARAIFVRILARVYEVKHARTARKPAGEVNHMSRRRRAGRAAAKEG